MEDGRERLRDVGVRSASDQVWERATMMAAVIGPLASLAGIGHARADVAALELAVSRPQVNEKELLAESMKWQVIKSSHVRMPYGHGPTSRWKLSVECLTRAGEALPAGGVEYALILDIRDPDGVAPVFQEMRAQLGSLGIQTSDIRTRAQARAQA